MSQWMEYVHLSEQQLELVCRLLEEGLAYDYVAERLKFWTAIELKPSQVGYVARRNGIGAVDVRHGRGRRVAQRAWRIEDRWAKGGGQ